MIVIAGAAFVTGVVTFIATAPYSLLAALCAAPMVGSLCGFLAGLGIAWQADSRARADRRAQAQIDEAVASLRGIAARAHGKAPAEKGASHDRAA
jgi:hypothetical protein